MSYDGKTSLQKALEQLHGKKLSFDMVASITNRYRERLNVPKGKPISTAADKLKIYQWEHDAITPPIEAPTTVALPVTKSRNKMKREKRFNEFTRLSFNVTSNAQRQHISLEPEYMKALELIAPNARNQWLSETVDNWIAENGVESSTRIVKCSIVNELVKMAV